MPFIILYELTDPEIITNARKNSSADHIHATILDMALALKKNIHVQNRSDSKNNMH